MPRMQHFIFLKRHRKSPIESKGMVKYALQNNRVILYDTYPQTYHRGLPKATCENQ